MNVSPRPIGMIVVGSKITSRVWFKHCQRQVFFRNKKAHMRWSGDRGGRNCDMYSVNMVQFLQTKAATLDSAGGCCVSLKAVLFCRLCTLFSFSLHSLNQSPWIHTRRQSDLFTTNFVQYSISCDYNLTWSPCNNAHWSSIEFTHESFVR